MKKRIFGLRAKFAVLFLLFAVIIMFSVGAVTYRTYRSSMMKRYASEAVTIAKLAASYLDGDEQSWSDTALHGTEMKNMTGWKQFWTISRNSPECCISM